MIFTSLLFSLLLHPPAQLNNSITKNGMQFEWQFINAEKLLIRVSAPTTGWVAVGINNQSNLVGSNLIMAAVDGDQTIISDRYVRALGDHVSMTELKTASHVEMKSGSEQSGSTTIEFTIHTKPDDDYHHTLKQGIKYYLTLAYSHEDDFMHHSAMRTAITQQL